MPVSSIGPVSFDGVPMETWLLKFDKEGTCTSPQTLEALLDRLPTSENRPIVLFSHGWNNDFTDATTMYRDFLVELERHIASRAATMERPLFIGLLWPSILLSFDHGLQMADTNNATQDNAEDKLITDLAEPIADQASRERFYSLVNIPKLNLAEAQELARLLASSLVKENEPAVLIEEDRGSPSGDDLIAALKVLQTLDGRETTDGNDIPISGTIQQNNVLEPETAGVLRYFDPRWLLRIASVYQMKDRAGTVGTQGVAGVLSSILKHAVSPLHLVGHSYGAKVVLSAMAKAELVRNAKSMLLLQPAVSHLCFASELPGLESAGGYRKILEKVEQSVLSTFSDKDFALHNLFHLALRRTSDFGELNIGAAGEPPSRFAALGGYGPRHSKEILIDKLPAPGEFIEFPFPIVPMAFDGSNDQINGHGDVTTSYTAWLLFCQLYK
jgi:hypothetical protein